MSFIDEIKQSGLRQFWSKKAASQEEIAAFEQDFAVSLPEAYKTFLAEFGCGVMGHTEIYGLGCPETGIPNVRFLINALKKQGQLFPEGVIPVSDANEGFYTCILCCSAGRFGAGSVVVCRPGDSVENARKTMQLLSKNFEEFCMMEIASQKKESLHPPHHS